MATLLSEKHLTASSPLGEFVDRDLFTSIDGSPDLEGTCHGTKRPSLGVMVTQTATTAQLTTLNALSTHKSTLRWWLLISGFPVFRVSSARSFALYLLVELFVPVNLQNSVPPLIVSKPSPKKVEKKLDCRVQSVFEDQPTER